MLVSEALGVVIKLHVPEIVREAGPEVRSVMTLASAFSSRKTQGISAHDIATKARTSPDKLGTGLVFPPARLPSHSAPLFRPFHALSSFTTDLQGL
jgi:hypothetical protein